MSGKTKKTCFNCGGAGKITVYTESEGMHNLGQWFHGKNYERPTKKITCPDCNGKGTIVFCDHDFKYIGSSKMGTFAYYKCRHCGERTEYNQGN